MDILYIFLYMYAPIWPHRFILNPICNEFTRNHTINISDLLAASINQPG